MSKRPMIWLTRPLGDSESFAAELARHGIDSIVAPVMRIEPTAPQEIHTDHIHAVLLTSRHARLALEMLPASARTLPIFCVGAATAELASAAGFLQVIRGSSDVLGLLPRVMEKMAAGSRLLYLAGEETRVDVALLLKPHDIHVEKVVTYIAHAETSLPEELIHAVKEGKVTGISLFSPRSARLAAQLLEQHGILVHTAPMDIYCLSLNVAEAAAALGGSRVHACNIPTRKAMRELIVTHSPEMV